MLTGLNYKQAGQRKKPVQFPTFTYKHILIIQILFISLLIYRMFFRFIYPSPPLFYDVNDTFMDYFNTAFWTYHKQQTYTVWLSIYPPFAHFLCFASYFFLDALNSRSIPGNPYDWRYNFLLFLPFLVMIALYFLSIYLLIRSRCHESKPLFKILLAISLALSVPSLFLIERGNLLIFCLVFINFGFLIKADRWSLSVLTMRSAMISLAAAVKPYLLLLVFQFKRPVDYLTFALTLVFSNLFAVVLWQPTKPEGMVTNQFRFVSIESGTQLLGKASYNFAINTYSIVIKLVKLFLAGSQRNLIVIVIYALLVCTVALLLYNIYQFYSTYRMMGQEISSTFIEFVTYTFIIFLTASLLTESNGYAITFLIPSIILFVSYFPRARFNIFEIIIICYIFFAFSFLPESSYDVDNVNNFSSIISKTLQLPLKFSTPTLTGDSFFRPLALQLFFLIFIKKIKREVDNYHLLLRAEEFELQEK